MLTPVSVVGPVSLFWPFRASVALSLGRLPVGLGLTRILSEEQWAAGCGPRGEGGPSSCGPIGGRSGLRRDGGTLGTLTACGALLRVNASEDHQHDHAGVACPRHWALALAAGRGRGRRAFRLPDSLTGMHQCTHAGVGGVGGEEGRDHFQIAGINRRFFLEEK